MWRIDNGMMQCFSMGSVCISQSERSSRGWTWEGQEPESFLLCFPCCFSPTKIFEENLFSLFSESNSWAITRFKHLFFMDETVGMIWNFSICVVKEIRFLTEWQCHLGYGAPLAAPLSCCWGGSVIQTDTDLNASYMVLLVWTSLWPEKGGQKECWR